jgi:hypothetical protein
MGERCSNCAQLSHYTPGHQPGPISGCGFVSWRISSRSSSGRVVVSYSSASVALMQFQAYWVSGTYRSPWYGPDTICNLRSAIARSPVCRESLSDSSRAFLGGVSTVAVSMPAAHASAEPDRACFSRRAGASPAAGPTAGQRERRPSNAPARIRQLAWRKPGCPLGPSKKEVELPAGRSARWGRPRVCPAAAADR